MSIFRVDRFTTPGPRCFTMPAGFYPDVEIHAWGGGGGSSNGVNGGGGGYAKTTINMAEGDIIELCVGSAGGQASTEQGGLGGLSYIGTRFAGGHGGDKGSQYPGAGGGGASAVYVNSTTGITETLVLVAAGGGGASRVLATGEQRVGQPGGVYSALASTTSGERGNVVGGGGAGAGKLGGKAVPNYGGNGGQNYALASVTASPAVIISGSGILVGGQSVIHYPSAGTGNAGYNGAVILILRRKMQIYNKDTGVWKRVSAVGVKVAGVYKNVQDVFTKVNGVWIPVTTTNTVPYKAEEMYINPGTYTWVCPADITKIKLKVYGGGAGGALGGGGAGGVATAFYAVTPGQSYTYTVGAGGALGANGLASSFGTVVANGGTSNGTNAGIGGTATAGISGIAISNVTGANGTAGYIFYYWYGWSYWNWGFGYNNFFGIGGYAYNRYYW